MLQAIKKTLVYAGIFDYPLTDSEIHYWLIEKKTPYKEVKTELEKLKLTQDFKKRKIRKKIAKKKWAIAKKTASRLSKIPTILSILVTGNLSMDNSSEIDDIDFLIIAQKNTIWTTRFLANLLLDILKIRRHPKDKMFKDKICLNMFLDADHLKIKDQNLYTAHELLQAKPIFNRHNTYQKFIFQNSWTQKYLPNAYEKINNNIGVVGADLLALSKVEGCIRPNLLFSFFEPIFAFFQKKYMSPKVTTEKILDGQLLFHPGSVKRTVLRKYKLLLTKA